MSVELNDMQGLLHEVRRVFPLSEYRLLLEFEEAQYRVVNVKPILDRGGVFRPLRDPDLFRTVRVGASGTVEWENGVDLDPDVLYAQSVPLMMPQV